MVLPEMQRAVFLVNVFQMLKYTHTSGIGTKDTPSTKNL